MALTPTEIAYRRRLKIAAVLSLMLHASCVVLAILNPGACIPEPPGLVPKQEPIVVHLQPDDADQPMRLVDPAVPSTEVPDDTDLIAETNSKAQDEAASEGDASTPEMNEMDEFDALGGAPLASPASPPIAVVSPPAPAPTEEPSAEPEPVEVEPKPVEGSVAVAPGATARAEEESQDKEPAADLAPNEPASERIEIAKAETVPMVAGDGGAPRARKRGGVEAEGFANFEAKQHELAPYLKTIREKVERAWRSALQVRYTGTTPTKAVIACTINPKGDVVKVEIVDGGESVSYGPLCKDAIQSAGPFGPFPFEVPEIYQNENLEIRWTFSFM
jgi:outer membrane biosynthesis protein TonB